MWGGRNTAAVLTGMGITETIAATLDEYVGLSVRLATDAALRRGLAARMRDARSWVLADTKPIRALEAVIAAAVEDRTACRVGID